MTIHIHGTYRAGVIYPSEPLPLLDNSHVELTVVPSDPISPTEAGPSAPKFMPDDLARWISEVGISVGKLPTDFSRADIYEDHD